MQGACLMQGACSMLDQRLSCTHKDQGHVSATYEFWGNRIPYLPSLPGLSYPLLSSSLLSFETCELS